MGRKSKKQLAEEKGLKDIYESLMNKINGVLDTYGEIKDVFHVVKELYNDEEVMALVNKIKDGNNDARMYILLSAAILQVIKAEMQDNDGIFDYNPPAE